MIVDPPYNISKNYHGYKFKDRDNLSYEKYTHLWVESIIPILRENATVYVCCDWKSSLVIGNVLEKYFNIQNRITWQDAPVIFLYQTQMLSHQSDHGSGLLCLR